MKDDARAAWKALPWRDRYPLRRCIAIGLLVLAALAFATFEIVQVLFALGDA
jgi:hypothetical protein